MQSRRMGERLWALRLIGGHACRQLSVRMGSKASGLLPARWLLRLAEWHATTTGAWRPDQRRRRIHANLLRMGLPRPMLPRLAARFVARDWLREVMFHRMKALLPCELPDHVSSIDWHDPHELWTAAAGRRRVVCLLPTGDVELALAVLLARPGTPAHYVVCSWAGRGSATQRMLQAVRRLGRRVELVTPAQHARAAQYLRQGATVAGVLDLALQGLRDRRTDNVEADVLLQLAREARVPVLLLGHRHGGTSGTLHVLGEFSAEPDHGARRLHAAAQAFMRAAPEDWRHLDR